MIRTTAQPDVVYKVRKSPQWWRSGVECWVTQSKLSQSVIVLSPCVLWQKGFAHHPQTLKGGLCSLHSDAQGYLVHLDEMLRAWQSGVVIWQPEMRTCCWNMRRGPTQTLTFCERPQAKNVGNVFGLHFWLALFFYKIIPYFYIKS